MTGGERYCLDADSLITPKNTAYRFDVWPQFWDFLRGKILEGVVYSCSRVYQEWVEGDDELSEWVKALRSAGLCAEATDAVQGRYRVVANYVYDHYEEHHVSKFLSGADPWAIAQAWADGSCLVTFEKQVAPSAKKVKIPNVCAHFEVRCINLYDMVQEIKAGEARP